ncbi:MAG TPA: isochorismatase family protein [Steroidobacteraceae bacterium]|nr:isochorismatase family protein [Steroidobacteraceae bacterium]
MNTLGPGDALLVVDVQLDFMPGGALGVTGGDAVVAPLNRLVDLCVARGLPVVMSRDWHPPGHCSFHDRGGPWPVHCVAGSAGAGFHPGLHRPVDAIEIHKATEPDRDAYSAFQGTGLAERLAALRVRRLVIGGLATDYCVRETVRDALAAGYDVVVLRDAVRAVDAHPGDGARALAEIEARGAALLDSAELASAAGAAERA